MVNDDDKVSVLCLLEMLNNLNPNIRREVLKELRLTAPEVHFYTLHDGRINAEMHP